MSRFRGLLGPTALLALLSLFLDASCSRPPGLNSADDSAATDSHPAPFGGADGKGSVGSNPGPLSAASDRPAKDWTNLPFRDPENLPSGTLLTVRLKNPVLANPEVRGTFEGVIDEPVAVEGVTLVARGTSVTGRVEAAQASKLKGNGYLRVTLDSIDISGKDLHLQTSSLFVRGNLTGHGPTVSPITLEKGRRLTFRLIEPAYAVQPLSSTR
jgi:hypothetical protein